MKKSVENMLRLQSKIGEIKHELNQLSDWSDAEVKNNELRIDIGILKGHLNHASGRASTVVWRLKRIG